MCVIGGVTRGMCDQGGMCGQGVCVTGVCVTGGCV